MLAQQERFNRYLDRKLLPFSGIETRSDSKHGINFVLVSHAPSLGVHYSPVDDLVVSVVLQSNYENVTRDIGFGRKRFKEMPGCVLITPPVTPSYWYFEGTPQILHICFPRDYLLQFLKKNNNDISAILERLARDPIHDPLISMLANRLWTTSAISSDYSRLCTEQLLNTILLALIDESRTNITGPDDNQSSFTGLAPWRLKRATELMEKDLESNISIDCVATEIGFSTCHFIRAFTASTGMTPHQWLSQKRIEHAKELLGNTSLPITTISVEMGFSSPAHFSGRFRQMVGVTPSAWRQKFTTTK